MESAFRPFLDRELIWIVGGARGVDLYATEYLLERGEYVWVVVPFTVADQPRECIEVIDHASFVTEMGLMPKFHPNNYHTRNDYMIDHAQLLLAFWNGRKGGTFEAIQYALWRGLNVRVYTLKELPL